MLEVGIGCRRHILNCKKRHNQKRRKNGQQLAPFNVAVETEQHIKRLRRRQHARQRGGLAVRRHQVRQHGHNKYAKPETAHPLDETCASAKQYQPDDYRKIHINESTAGKGKAEIGKITAIDKKSAKCRTVVIYPTIFADFIYLATC